ncbi:MAG: DNA polymerase III subunit alpha, partial [Gemmatimonadota bacterium]
MASPPTSAASSPAGFCHLHVRSWFSFLSGASSPTQLASQAHALGMESLALTDVSGVYGVVRFQQVCRRFGLHPVIGAEVVVEGKPLALLCRSRDGYANLCRLLTEAHLRQPGAPESRLEDLARYCGDLICLTGGREGLLWQLVAARQVGRAEEWLATLRHHFDQYLYVELCHGLLQGDSAQVDRLHRLAQHLDLPSVVANDVRFATPEHHRRFDLLTCIRLGIHVADPHPQRPRNAEAWLKPEADLRRLIPIPEAFQNAATVARSCQVDLVPECITPPAAHLPERETARTYLARLCRDGLESRYPPDRIPDARSQMERELAVIGRLDLEEFFLVVHEVVGEARHRGIRCAGRGSAANSIVAFLLGITSVDPLRHNLLFERFLHGGRKGTPDIDVDFDSDRRDEIIDWMEERFGIEQTAMTATLVTYKLRLALRDVAKALGWHPSVADRLTESVPSGEVAEVTRHRSHIEGVLGRSPLVDLLVELVAGLEGCPRHLGLHVGGMVLSRQPLHRFSPVQVSTNGVKMVQFDKLDIEAMGLVKLDVLGLRMLAALSEAVELVERHEGQRIELESLPLDDEGAFDLIRSGKTLALFQIESMGQMHLIARNQPRTFDDLVVEIALFRPGPLQGNMVHPYVRRRKGEEPPQYDHPDLEPILRDTFGIILFQEQVLEIAHRFAGMSLEEADDFRALMTRFRDPGRMEAMRQRFVSGAVGRGVPQVTADLVFDKVAKFVGYGFCRSHAAAFAQTVYHSAWMKRYHPAAYLAAFMQHRPGMYNLMTLEEEARRCGVPVLPPHVNASGVRYDLERLPDGRLAIRKPLSAVDGISEEVARQIIWCRMAGPFTSVEDLVERLTLDQDALDVLARCGALDALAGSSRKALWEVGVLGRLGPAAARCHPSLFDLPRLRPEDVPELPDLTGAARLSWDYKTHGAARAHPLVLARRLLADLGVPPIQACYHLLPAFDDRGPTVTVAGVAIVRQRPPTARGFMFLTLEDETGYLQCVVPPRVQERLYDVLVLPAVIARGQLQATGNWRALLLEDAWPLEGIFGGY